MARKVPYVRSWATPRVGGPRERTVAIQAIMVVEDEPGIAEIIEFSLNDEPGYQATTVNDGAAALAFLAEVRVDLIILDINLPGLDGFAIHDLARARAETSTTPTSSS